MEDYKNYQSVNQTENAAEKAWSVSVKRQKTIQQATLTLNNGKAYKYASRYPVADGNVAIVGNILAYQIDKCVYPSATTGSMGIVSDVRPKLEIKRAHATELDFVFTPAANKRIITECINYIELPGDEITLQYDKRTDSIYPITFLIRKLLAAASIIAFPKLAGTEAAERAKSYICQAQIIDEEMGELRQGAPEYVDISLRDIHVDVDGKNENELDAINLDYLKDGIMEGYYRDGKIVPAVNEYVNKYAYIGAVSIMVRGGFVNLLQAFLSANPPMEGFCEELLADIGSNGNERALKLLKDYISAQP